MKTPDEILDEVARRHFNALAPNPDPAKGQWDYDGMPESSQAAFRQTLKQVVDTTLELSSPLEYLAELQEQSPTGFHRDLGCWVDDKSSVARALRSLDARRG